MDSARKKPEALFHVEVDEATWSLVDPNKRATVFSLSPSGKSIASQVYQESKPPTTVVFDKAMTDKPTRGLSFSPRTATGDDVLDYIAPIRPPPSSRVVYEAALRAVFTCRVRNSVEERFEQAELLRRAFNIQPAAHEVALQRAQQGAQYRLADVEARIEALRTDRDPNIGPSHFLSRQMYTRWKDEELRELLQLKAELARAPPMTGTLQVHVQACTIKLGGGLFAACTAAPPETNVFFSASCQPTGVATRAAASPGYQSSRFPKAKRMEWDYLSPPLRFASAGDELVVELWQEGSRGVGMQRLDSKGGRVGVDDGATLVGSVGVPFGKIEEQAGGAAGSGVKAESPAVEYPLWRERRRKGSVVLSCSFTVERLSKGQPGDPAVIAADPEARALYDALLRKAAEESDGRGVGRSSLSPIWLSILDAFAGHHRVRRTHCSLALMDRLAKSFRTDTEYLEALVDEWAHVCQLAGLGRLTLEENHLQNIVVKALEPNAVLAITRFEDVFPRNRPQGALSALLEVLALLFFSDRNPAQLELPMRDWIETAMNSRFNRLFFGSDDPSPEQCTVSSAAAFTKLAQDIASTLKFHAKYYAASFPRPIKLLDYTAPVLYRQLADHLVVFLKSQPTPTFTRSFQDIACAVGDLHDLLDHKYRVTAVENEERLDLEQLFAPGVQNWINKTSSSLLDWVTTSLLTESWQPLSSGTNQHARFSASVVNLFILFDQLLREVNPALVRLKFGHRTLIAVEGAMSRAVEAFVGFLEKECMQELPQEFEAEDASPRGPLSRPVTPPSSSPQAEIVPPQLAPPVALTNTLCVKLNDISMTRKFQLELEQRLAQEWAEELLPQAAPDGAAAEGADDEADDKARSVDSGDLGFEDGELEGEEFAVSKGAVPEKRLFKGEHFGPLIRFVDRSYLNVMGALVECIQSNMVGELLFAVSGKGGGSMERRLVPLADALDEHLRVMNNGLMPEVFKRLLGFIWTALINSLEEFALHTDEALPPITRPQLTYTRQAIDVLTSYFHGEGDGLSLPELDAMTARLHRMLTLCEASTQQLATAYWRAWDRRHHLLAVAAATAPAEPPADAASGRHESTSAGGLSDAAPITTEVPTTSASRLEKPPQPTGAIKAPQRVGQGEVLQEASRGNVGDAGKNPRTSAAAAEEKETPPHFGGLGEDRGDELLSVQDLLQLLRQRTGDDEAMELVASQEMESGGLFLRLTFGLPEDEEIQHTFRCSNSKHHKGTLYVCKNHVCFRTLLTNGSADTSKLVWPLGNVARLDKHKASALLIALFNKHPVRLSQFKAGQRDAAFDAIVFRVLNTGFYLERYLSEYIRGTTGASKEVVLKRFKCTRYGRLRNKPGELICSSTYFCFHRPGQHKLKQVQYVAIKDITTGSMGVAHGVIVETLAGKQYCFKAFEDLRSLEVMYELRKLVFNEVPPSPDVITAAVNNPDPPKASTLLKKALGPRTPYPSSSPASPKASDSSSNDKAIVAKKTGAMALMSKMSFSSTRTPKTK